MYTIKTKTILAISLLPIYLYGSQSACAATGAEYFYATDAAYSDGLRRWTPKDSIQIREILSSQNTISWGQQVGEQEIMISPTGEYFFFVSKAVDDKVENNVMELNIFKRDDVIDDIKSGHKTVAPYKKVSCRDKAQSMRGATWEDDGRGIIFYGIMEPGERTQLYRVDLVAKTVTALTKHISGDVLRAWRHGTSVIYNQATTRSIPPPDDPFAPIVVSQAAATRSILRGTSGTTNSIDTFAKFDGRPAWKLGVDVHSVRLQPWFSPSGKYAVIVALPNALPAQWAEYNGSKRNYEQGPRQLLERNEYAQFMLVDLENQNVTPLLDAPTGESTRVGEVRVDQNLKVPFGAFWTSDSKQVILVNTAMPLSARREFPDMAGMAYILACDIHSKRWQLLERLQQPGGVSVEAVRWLKEGDTIIVNYSKGKDTLPPSVFSYENGQWIGKKMDAMHDDARTVRSIPHRSLGKLSVRVVQGPNQPPCVIASVEGREIALTPQDPVLAGVWRAEAAPFKWRDSKGIERTGDLFLPRESKPPLALVVQLTTGAASAFRPDGNAPNTYAAQSLVARGLTVLNIHALVSKEPIEGIPGIPKEEIRTVNDIVESGVISLSQKHGIDLSRVGLVGFSRRGYMVHHLITRHERLKYAAALIEDSVTGSYGSYLMGFAANFNIWQGTDADYGGSFWENKQNWLKLETSFNTDRIDAPVLFIDHRNTIGGGNMPITMGAFRANSKPFEYWIIPNSGHQLELPQQRRASLEANVDWMCFWLQHYEDPSLEKKFQYERWRELRVDLQRSRTKAMEKGGNSPLMSPSYATGSSPALEITRGEMLAAGVADPGADPQVLNGRGYYLLYKENDVEMAIQYFKWNLVLFPEYKRDLFDSLAEGYLQLGDVDNAIKAYEASLVAGERHPWAKRYLQVLKGAPHNIHELQKERRDAYLKTHP